MAKLDLSGPINAAFSLVTGFIGGLLKGKVKAKITDLNSQANYAAALDQKNKSMLTSIIILGVLFVAVVIFILVRNRRK